MLRSCALLACLGITLTSLTAHSAELFFDDFESGTNQWKVSGLDWTTNTEDSVSGTHCFHESPGGNYENGAFAVARVIYPIDMSTATNPVLSFWHKYNTYNASDTIRVQVSTNAGSSWGSPIATWSSLEPSWRYEELDMSAYVGVTQLMFRFVLVANTDNRQQDGWHIDNVRLDEWEGTTTNRLEYPFYDDFESGTNQWKVSGLDWTNTTEQTVFGSYCFHESPGGNYDNGAQAEARIIYPIDMSTATNPVLSFWHKYQTYNASDTIRVQVSTNAGWRASGWITVASWSSGEPSWRYEELDMSAYAGVTQLVVRFILTADNDNKQQNGWYIDNVRLDEWEGITTNRLEYPFYDDFESGTNQWKVSGLDWTNTTEQTVFGSYCFHESPGGNYDNGAQAEARIIYPIDMSTATNPVLSFWHKYQTYNASDTIRVQVSTNAGWRASGWITVASWSSGEPSWRYEELDMSAYVGVTQLMFRFVLVADNDNKQQNGWYIDNVRLDEWEGITTNRLEYPFYDDFESGTNQWKVSGLDWTTNTEDSVSGTHCFHESPGGNYENGAFAVARVIYPIDMSTATNPVLSFWHKYNTYNASDTIRVQVSTNAGSSWGSPIATWSSLEPSWRYEELDMSAYVGVTQLMFRFVLVANTDNRQQDGWHIDNVRLDEWEGTTTNRLEYPFYDDFESGTNQWKVSGLDWTNTTEQTVFGSYCFHESPGGNYDNGAQAEARIIYPIDMSTATNPVLSFWHKYQTYNASDTIRVQVSTNAGWRASGWITVASWSSGEPSWRYEELDMSAYAGVTQLVVRFILTADNDNKQQNGWYIDNVRLDEWEGITTNRLEYPFYDDFESGTNQWKVSGLDWTNTTEQTVFGSYCFHESPGGNYDNGAQAEARIIYPIDMSTATNPVLSFWHKYQTYNASDTIRVQVSTNAGWRASGWITVASWSSGEPSWRYEELDMSAYVGVTQLMFRFVLVADNDNKQQNGWYIDNVRLDEWEGITTNRLEYPFYDDFESGTNQWKVSGLDWTTNTEDSVSGTHCFHESPSGNYENGAFAVARTIYPIDMSMATNPVLTLWHKYQTYNASDTLRIYVSTNAGWSWESTLASWTGSQLTWRYELFDMSSYAGVTQFMFRLALVANTDNRQQDGWHIDDVWLGEALAPEIVSTIASNVGPFSATATGTLLTNGTPGSQAQVWLFWGSTDGGTVKTNWENAVGLGTQSLGAVTNPISALWPNSDYYYRFYATNSTGRDSWSAKTVSFRALGGTRLLVDLSGDETYGGAPSDPEQPMQAGFDTWVISNDLFNAAGGTTVTNVFSSLLGTGGMLRVELSQNINSDFVGSRDYESITNGPFVDRSDLISDGALRNHNGLLTLHIPNLVNGNYRFRTWHHNVDVSTPAGIFDVQVTDSLGTRTDFTGRVNSQGRAPDPATHLEYAVMVTSPDVVTIEFTSNGGGTRHMFLNGFEVVRPIHQPEGITIVIR